MASYRLYRLDGAGRINAAEWIEAIDDDDAPTQARAQCGPDRFELWQRERRIERAAG